MEFPAQYKYTKDHEWMSTPAGNVVKIGVTGYALEQLGDIVHIELPGVGETFDAGASFGTIESTKTVSDLYMPVKSKVVEVNEGIRDKLDSLPQDPYDSGWLIKVELASGADQSQLLTSKDYESYLKENG